MSLIKAEFNITKAVLTAMTFRESLDTTVTYVCYFENCLS